MPRLIIIYIIAYLCRLSRVIIERGWDRKIFDSHKREGTLIGDRLSLRDQAARPQNISSKTEHLFIMCSVITAHLNRPRFTVLAF